MNERIGEETKNKFGSKMKIIEYRKSEDIDVYFEEYDWIAKNKQYNNFKIGNIKCPYEPRLYNSGYLGEGKYNSRENGELTKAYSTWNSMIQRCCSENFKIKHPTYSECKCCEEWLNFQNFAEWFENNYYEIEGERMHLDKDILTKNNKIYSPDKCIFVTQRINDMFVKKDSNRGELPIGISVHRNKFRVSCKIKNGRYCREFTTIEKAFSVYKELKENYIKEVADEYKNKIPQRLYKAMYSYKVEISD